MSSIPGYKLLEKINETLNTAVYRAEKETDQQAVIIKLLKSDYPTPEDLFQLRHEYQISSSLQLTGIVKPIKLENHRNSIALILEDSGGESFHKFSATCKLNLQDSLKIAIQLAEILSKLHENQVIHKDIKPQNIIIDSVTREVKITDFSIATRLHRETQNLSNPAFLEGTLAYMSPEQTGRMNRVLDYRSDFYSFGVTLYEMLTGHLPFKATDPMELVHCHIAKQPIAPHELNPEIPPAISSIVMKLLAKNAEDRYQSAYGLKIDLEQCLIQLQETGEIADFIPGKRDKSGQLLIPQKLYGREAEVTTLMNSFGRVSQGKSEMMLVSGYSGIGKSCLVQEIHKPIVEARGYFIAGKFDQFKRNIPYAALIQAFQELIRQLLTESSQKIAIYKKQLLNVLGDNGQIIIEVIPEVELIIGKQPEVTQLGPTESQNRFNRVFQQFIHVFCHKSHPLVLFLDDLQWSDTASLKLIQLLVTDPDSRYFLLMGAYRDNEVSPTHPLMVTLEEVQKSGSIVNTIILHPLELSTISQLIADTLGENRPEEICYLINSSENPTTKRSQELAKLVFSKTQGNPFFLTHFLHTIHTEKLLYFDFNKDAWDWSLEEIQSFGIADSSVVELVSRNIKKLPKETVKVLKLAACIGNHFNLNVLATVNEESPRATAHSLWEALQAGLILPLNNAYKIPMAGEWLRQNEESGQPDSPSLITQPYEEDDTLHSSAITYRFLHDRVQQAAYSLIPENQKKSTHLKIGQLLLKKVTSHEPENIFDIVNQLNMGAELITELAEKEQLAVLNLLAGKRAKSATAYEAAVRYLNVGLAALTESSWENRYDLTLELYLEAATASYLNTDYKRAEYLLEASLENTKNLLHRIKVYELQIQVYSSQNKMQLAIDIALLALKMLEVPLLQQSTTLPAFKEKLKLKMEDSGIEQIENLANLPPMTDAYKLAALRILNALISPAYVANPALFSIIVFTMIELCLEYGNSVYVAYAYTLYGFLLCGALGDIESGYRYGQLSVNLLEKIESSEVKCKVLSTFNGFIRHWKEPARIGIDSFWLACQVGLDIGDLEYSSYALLHYCVYPLLFGDSLESVAQKQAQYLELMYKLKQSAQTYALQLWSQLTLNLIGEAEDKYSLIGTAFNESEMLPILIESKNSSVLFWFFLAKSMLLYLFKKPEAALENIKLGLRHSEAVVGMMYAVEHNFYYSLTLLALYPDAASQEQKPYLKQVEANQTQLHQWAKYAPANYQHKYDLVEAEKARVLEQVQEAMAYYDRAIAGATEQRYIQEAALASELAAEFYNSIEREKISQLYFHDAYYSYSRWGATEKVRDLASRYPQFFSDLQTPEPSNIEIARTMTFTTTGGNSIALDLSTVSKASLVLASEIILDNLLEKLLKIVMENAGARTGYLLLEKEDDLVLEAMGFAERNEVILCSSSPIENPTQLPLSLLNYVARTQSTVVLNDALNEGRFAKDPYMVRMQPKSVLCMPIINQGQFIGLIYLENNLTIGAFTKERLEILKLLGSQIAISLKNALLYDNLEDATGELKEAKDQLEEYSRSLEQKVSERTLELQDRNKRLKEQAAQLKKTLQELQTTQSQLIQTEKMSSLGQLVAGIAHEINNPINFIYGNLSYASQYFEQLLHLLHLYQQELPNTTSEIQEYCDAYELDFLSEDVPKLMSSMRSGAERIRQIVLSLRNFSRLDEAEMKPVDIHEGIDSTLLILQHRLKEKVGHPAIQVVKEYGQLPNVECYAGQLNQVFMNIITNAIDVLESSENFSPSSHRPTSQLTNPTIQIRTEVVEGNKVAIRIIDNGSGMTESVRSQVFNPFYTTKPVGAGTGLGLSISYQIVVEKHKGRLKCISAPGQGTEFVIEIPLKQTN